MNRAAILIASTMLWAGNPARAEAASPRARVTVTPAATSPSAPRQLVAASVAARRRATISTRVSATVASVLVEEGARVRKGEVLVTLDDADVRAQLEAAEVAVQKAALHRRRIEALAVDRAAAQAELDVAIGLLAQAEAAAGVLRTALRYTSLRAPFDARVQSKRVSAGDLVNPGEPLLELEGGGFELQATLSQAEASALHEGARLQFEAEGLDGAAEVFAISAGADPVARRQLVRARVLGPASGLRSGAFARLALPAAARDSLWVPRAALFERGELTGVFVVHEGRAELRWLALGDAEGGGVAVRAGLRAGELVIADPGGLADGTPVEVTNAR
ncbi:MAG TPA: efflux RND transporter periplasmic adaptor subunit [Myxococcales bacterium]|nr:efflux RND transporter periplasmic adaptor subunit [Myxococcales bacterium]